MRIRALSIFSILAPILIDFRPAIADYGVLGSDNLQIAGDIMVTARVLDKLTAINRNIRQDDPFNFYRIRTFLTGRADEHLSYYIEMLWDSKAAPRIQGAYLQAGRYFGGLTIKFGAIPSPFGNFSHRSTYYNQSGLIGVPVIWHYSTPLQRFGQSSNASLMSGRNRVNNGLPLAYDACWENGLAFLWRRGMIDATAAVTTSTLSNMSAQNNKGFQQIYRLGAAFGPGFRSGVSWSQGPYVEPEAATVLPERVIAYQQTAEGFYVEHLFDHWEFYGEVLRSTWEAAYVYENEVSATGGYLEGRWNFRPGWFMAARVDQLVFDKISTTNDGLGPKATWGFDFLRYEAALGWRPSRSTMVRLDYQLTDFKDDRWSPVNLLALQTIVTF
ncbi:MAG: hypothetical protein FJY67_08840 [Calditrichaeota bacterium]|nr:hypothetical protein [Calditrichota bacterium]